MTLEADPVGLAVGLITQSGWLYRKLPLFKSRYQFYRGEWSRNTVLCKSQGSSCYGHQNQLLVEYDMLRRIHSRTITFDFWSRA